VFTVLTSQSFSSLLFLNKETNKLVWVKQNITDINLVPEGWIIPKGSLLILH
jgi:hypothetical protein